MTTLRLLPLSILMLLIACGRGETPSPEQRDSKPMPFEIAVEPVGGAVNAQRSADGIAIAAGRTPVVAFRSGGHLFVKSWSESEGWVLLGAALGESGSIALDPAIATSPEGGTVVAWVERDGAASTVRVARWNGANWSDLGESAMTSTGEIATPRIAAGEREIVVAVRESSNGGAALRVRAWSGDGWADRGSAGLRHDGEASVMERYALVLDGDTPRMAWVERTASGLTVACSGSYDREAGRWTVVAQPTRVALDTPAVAADGGEAWIIETPRPTLHFRDGAWVESERIPLLEPVVRQAAAGSGSIVVLLRERETIEAVGWRRGRWSAVRAIPLSGGADEAVIAHAGDGFYAAWRSGEGVVRVSRLVVPDVAPSSR